MPSLAPRGDYSVWVFCECQTKAPAELRLEAAAKVTAFSQGGGTPTLPAIHAAAKKTPAHWPLAGDERIIERKRADEEAIAGNAVPVCRMR
jgi:hypothetical protein